MFKQKTQMFNFLLVLSNIYAKIENFLARVYVYVHFSQKKLVKHLTPSV